jgi:hypothetical protein
MDHEIDKQEPSSTEGGEMNYKVGDKVWVLCEVTGFDRRTGQVKVSGPYGGNFWTMASECRPVEQAPRETTPKQPTQGQKLAELAMKAIWAANHAVNETSVTKEPLATEPNTSEIPNSSSEPLLLGDAVRFVSPGHNRHGTEGILKSIHHGPKNAYLFVSDCGQFHRYCTIAELEHYDKAGTVDVKGSMQSLDGADTIQEGDLQWTDRDGKYRLCNFTIGMRVHEAIQRGKAHGEKWVFYRKFMEASE